MVSDANVLPDDRSTVTRAFGKARSAEVGRRIVWTALTFVIASGVILVVLQALLRGEAIHAGEQVTQAFARLAEDQATRTIQSVDQTLQLVETQLMGMGGIVTPPAAERLGSVFRTYMKDRPFLRGLFVLDAKGTVVAGLSSDAMGRNLSDRDYFKHYFDSPHDGFEVHAPVVSREKGSQVIIGTRPWLRANGDFAGVVVGAVDPAYLSRIWGSENIGGGNTTSLLRSDGTMLMRTPYLEEAIGQIYAGQAIRALPERPNGTLQGVSLVDGRDRLVSYRTLSAYPDLLVIVSQTIDEVLAAWRQNAILLAVGWLAGSAVLVALSVWLLQEWQRRAQVEDELAASSDRLSAVMDHTVDGLIVIDQAGSVLSFSKPAERIFGYAAAEVIGRNVNMLMPEPYRSSHDGYIGAYLRTGIAQIIGIGREVSGRRKDGTVFPMDLAVGEVPGVIGGRHFVGTVRDITRSKAVEDQLRQAQKMEAVGQLTGGVAHDFNNLLAVMLGNVEMAREGKLDAETEELLEAAQRAGERGAELTARLLSFSRRQTLLPRRVDLNALVRDVVGLLRRTIDESIHIELKLDPEAVYSEVDPGQLENALLNLAVNARDAMPHGGLFSIATSSVVLDEGYAGSHTEVSPGAYRVLSVSDSGMGMMPEVQARVFEPFFTTKEVGKGSGLGLSMVYGFVKQSGGHVSVYSEVGRGTTIRLFLPATNEAGEPDTTPQAAPGEVIGQGQSVLVVEDDAAVRTLVATLLRRLGFQPLLAVDALAAQDMLAGDADIALMITDVVMPKGVTGIELAKWAQRSHPAMPVIYISGYSSETEVLAGIVRAGGTLVSKPFSKAQLAEAILKVLQKRNEATPA